MRQPLPTPSTPAPKLRLIGPMMAATVIMASLAGAAFHVTLLAPFDRSAALAEASVIRGGMQEVAHPTGGRVLRILARDGQDTTAGEPVAVLDAGTLDTSIEELKAQSAKTGYHLALVRKEAQQFAELLEQRLASRDRVDALERQAAALELEAASVLARIAAAERDLARMELRSPVSGVVDWTIKAEAGATLLPGETLARIIPYSDRITIAARVPADAARGLAKGMEKRVHVDAMFMSRLMAFAGASGAGRPMGRIVWIGPQESSPAGPYHPVHLELVTPDAASARRIAAIPGLGRALVLADEQPSFVELLLAPLRHHLTRKLRA